MASGSPMMNGDISRGHGPGVSFTGQAGSLEETLQQMHTLIKENRELKEALKSTNSSMKERFKGLSAWKERQAQERGFLEERLEEARGCLEALARENDELKRRVQELDGGAGGMGQAANQNLELDALRAQVVRLQAEKNDLVAMNSELQLKMRPSSPENSFIEIRIAEGEMNVTKDLTGGEKDQFTSSSSRYDMGASRLESEELTVSQLLQSLRNETQRVERLQLELQAAKARITELEEREAQSDSSTQTSMPPEETLPTPLVLPARVEASGRGSQEEEKVATEVENLKGQMRALFSELQHAQCKLGEAEDMKKKLQDRCRDMEQDLVTLRAQLVEKHAVQSENDRLKLQVDSMQAVNLLEQRKVAEERSDLAQLKDAYTKLFEDYNEIKEERKKKQPSVSAEEASELQTRLASAEQALAAKQQQIDSMKQEIFQKEKELETISVFQAQADVYSSDFYAERAAREKIHEEKERLAAQLDFVKKQNVQLQDEMDSLGRQSLSDMQRRHVPLGANPQGGAAPHSVLRGRGVEPRDWQQQVSFPEHICPKCNEALPDLDTLQIHIMDCII